MDILLVTDESTNLMSVSPTKEKVCFRKKIISLTADRKHGLYSINFDNNITKETANMISKNTRTNQTYDWHLKLGHINKTDQKKMPKEELMVELN